MYLELLMLGITFCGLFANSFSAIDLSGYPAEQDYECPDMCICDLFMDLNRANCSHQNLIGANIGMSSYVEVLDLSDNDITVIDNQCFSYLHHLISVTVNDNAIYYIDLDAFSGLKKLQTIILSHNRLQSFDNRILEQNPQIFNVNLAENNFMHLPNEPFLKSQSLQILDLHECKMTNLPVRLFEELPNIRSIDLSGNLLIVLNSGPFVQNYKLRLLNIEGNPLPCDVHVKMTLVQMTRNRIKVFFQKCGRVMVTTSPMFDRMRSLPTTTIATTTKQPDAKSNGLAKIWRINRNETCPLNDSKQVCELYNQCMVNLSSCNVVAQQSQPVKEIEFDITSRQSWMQFVKVNIAFYAGLAIGTVFGMLIVCMMSIIVSKYFTPSKHSTNESNDNRRNRNRRNRSSVIRTEIHRSNEQLRSQPVPLLPVASEVVRYNAQQAQRPSNSFFSLFFERPVRHRYCRQLNRSATNLVRRLSQSRLFLNATRTENANYRSNYVRTNTQESVESHPQSVIDSESDDAISDISLSRSASVTLVRSASLPSMCPELDGGAISRDPSAPPFDEIRSFASETNVFFERAETPPPPYTEFIAHKQTTT